MSDKIGDNADMPSIDWIFPSRSIGWKGNKSLKRRIMKRTTYVTPAGIKANTRKYAIAWGVIHRPYSVADLKELCRDPEAPSYRFINKTWNGYHRYYCALVKAGMPPRPPNYYRERRSAGEQTGDLMKRLCDSESNLIRLAAENNLMKRADYNAFRKDHPELRYMMPCGDTLVKRYGTWSKFSYEVMKHNADMVLTAYVSESVRRGHWLYLKECDEIGIPIRQVMDLLRPRIFNALCIRKAEALGEKKLKRFGKEAKRIMREEHHPPNKQRQQGGREEDNPQ